MAKLPSKAELEQLYHEKGHDALVWYAWRCALRVSPLIGRPCLNGCWEKDSVRHIFSVLRPLLILANWSKTLKSRCSINAIQDTANNSAAAMVTTDVVVKAAVKALEAALSPTHLTTPYSVNAIIARFLDTVIEATDAAALAAAYSGNAANNTCAIKVDYNLLMKQTSIDHSFWFSCPLWTNKSLDGGFKPKEVRPFEVQLAIELGNLGLAFLVQDLQFLWEMKTPNRHTEMYSENLSETIIRDPIALREAILGKDRAEKLQTVRVLLLGPGGAGKSSLRDRLLGRSVEQSLNKNATTGVEYEWLDQSVLRDINPELELDTQLDLRLWDFGGQTIFHGLHRAFLHENCVYVLVVDSRHEQAPDNWLYQIQDLTGTDKPNVLVITNRYDHCDTRQNETRLLREFPDLLSSTGQFFYFSCHRSNERQFKAFVQTLINQSMNSRHQVLKLAMDVQRKMKVEFKGQVFLRKNRIKSLIPEHLVEKFHNAVVNHLDQLGYMIPVEEGETTYCLRPEWAIRHAYDLVHAKTLRDKQGIAPKEVLEEILEDKVGDTEIDYLIQFLRSRNLCQKLNNNQYFFPDSAPANEPPIVRELQETGGTLALRFDFPFLPLGIHTRFIDQLFHTDSKVIIPDTGAIWRQGFILQSGNTIASVQYQWRKSCIEITMAGDVERFADMLTAFHNALNVVLKGGCLRGIDVQPHVIYGEGQVYSIHSSTALVDKLREITNIDQLFPKVVEMASKKIEVHVGDNSNVAIDAHHFTQKSHSDNTTLAVNADQRQQIAALASELLKGAATLPTEQLGAVFEVKKALDAPAGDEKSQGLLGRVWQGINDSVGLAANGLTATDLALKYKDPILAAFAGATALIGS